MLDTIRQLSREVKLQTLIIDSYIPKEYQELLERHASWHEDTGEWHMVRLLFIQTRHHKIFHLIQHGIAYAGNNMRKQPSPDPVDQVQGHMMLCLIDVFVLFQFPGYDTASAYLTYRVGSQEVHSLSKSVSGSSVIAASGGRPKGALRKSSGGSSKSSSRYIYNKQETHEHVMLLVVVCLYVQEGREGADSGELS